MADRPPLNWEASAHSNNPTISDALPPEVASCFRNARFLHLATCSPSAEPHISLMSHTFLPSTPYCSGPTIIMTTNPASRKTAYLTANPRVALLVHDWVSPRDDRAAEPEGESGAESGPGGPVSSEPAAPTQHEGGNARPRRQADATIEHQRRRPSSSLASMLLGFNRAALGRISVTVSGTARVLEQGGAEERWCRARHVESHGYKGAIDEEGDDGCERVPSATSPAQGEGFLEGEDVRVVIVKVREGRIADWKGGVKDFVIRCGDEEGDGNANGTS